MINYIEYLNLPTKLALILVALLLFTNIIGEILEFKGKIVPEIFKIRKYFIRKREERKMIHQIPAAMDKMQKTLDEFNSHYSKDNINKRDKWIEGVNKKLQENDNFIKELDKKMDRNNADTLDLLIDNKRDTIISFASYVIDENVPVTREQFNRIFKKYADYEKIIEKNGMTNGETDIAIRIITEAYEKHMRNHTFVEDIRGYNE